MKDYTFIEHEPQTDLLISTGQPNYRIPAITKAYNGDIIAVADYRFTGSDIGYGRLDLHSKVSTDNGTTWSDMKEVVRGIDYVKGQTSSPYLQTGFGDPCIVADRESNRVLLMSCTGDVMFPSGTRTYHQGIARFYSEDNGQTSQKASIHSSTLVRLVRLRVCSLVQAASSKAARPRWATTTAFTAQCFSKM